MVSLIKAGTVCLTAGLLVGFQFLLQGMPAIMVPELQSDFHIGLSQIGVLSSAMLYLYVILQAPAGRMAMRYGEKNCLIAGVATLSILCVLFTMVENYTSAIIVRMLMGVSSAPGVVCTMMLIHRWFPPRLFALIAGIWEAMNMGISALGPAFFSRLIPFHGWHFVMYVLAIIGVCILLLTVLLVKNHPESGKGVFSKAITESDSAPDKNGHLRMLMTNRVFVFSCIICFSMFAIINVFASLWAVPFMQTLYPEEPVLATQSVSLIFVGLAIGAPVTGALSSCFNNEKSIMSVCIVLSVISMTFLMYMPLPLPVTDTLLFILGVSSSIYMLPFSLIRSCVSPNSLYLANAILNGACIIAAPLLQPLVGIMLNHQAIDNSIADFRFALLPLYLLLWIALASLAGIKLQKQEIGKANIAADL